MWLPGLWLIVGMAKLSRYFRNHEANRERSRIRQEQLRRKRGQLTMAEYRARVHSEAEAHRVEKIRLGEEKARAQEAARLAARSARPSYYEANKEASLARSRAWRLANPDRYRELQRNWRKANREKRKARKVRKRETTKAELFKAQNGRCAYCRAPLSKVVVHVDHIMPLSRGGPNQRANLQLTCEPCNRSKSAHHPVEFAQSLGRLL